MKLLVSEPVGQILSNQSGLNDFLSRFLSSWSRFCGVLTHFSPTHQTVACLKLLSLLVMQPGMLGNPLPCFMIGSRTELMSVSGSAGGLSPSSTEAHSDPRRCASLPLSSQKHHTSPRDKPGTGEQRSSGSLPGFTKWFYFLF